MTAFKCDALISTGPILVDFFFEITKIMISRTCEKVFAKIYQLVDHVSTSFCASLSTVGLRNRVLKLAMDDIQPKYNYLTDF